MPVFNIHHITKYEYTRPVKESVNEIKIYPYRSNEQEVLQHELNISGQPEVLLYSDYWGNRTGVFNRIESHKELIIDSKLIVRTLPAIDNHITNDIFVSDIGKYIQDDIQLLELAKPSVLKNGASLYELFALEFLQKKSIFQVIQECSETIYLKFQYTKGITTIETTVDEILEQKGGVCQDFAHVLLEVLRQLNIPCRYVSGYICPNKNGMRGESATHAWVEVYIPESGWVGIDPTNNVLATDNHVKLAVGRNFRDCTPTKGYFKGQAKQNLSVYVSVGYEDGQFLEELLQVKTEISDTSPDTSEDNAPEEQQQQ